MFLVDRNLRHKPLDFIPPFSPVPSKWGSYVSGSSNRQTKNLSRNDGETAFVVAAKPTAFMVDVMAALYVIRLTYNGPMCLVILECFALCHFSTSLQSMPLRKSGIFINGTISGWKQS